MTDRNKTPLPELTLRWAAFGGFIALCLALISLPLWAFAQWLAPQITETVAVLAAIPDTIALMVLASIVSVGVYYAFKD
jgi:hypothetical protein